MQRGRSEPREAGPGRSPTLGSGRCYLSVVLEVPEEVRRLVASGGREPADGGVPAHITVFITERTPGSDPGDEALLERVRAACAGVGPGPVRLRGAATFRPVSDVVYVRVAEGAERLRRLHRGCAAVLPDASPFDYHPHLTVAQGLAGAELDRVAAELADVEAVFDAVSLGVFTGDLSGWRRIGEIALRA